MLDNEGFDLWADGYDRSVGISDQENAYPFAGYRKVLGRIFQTVTQRRNAVVLDLGFGTGTLTTKLYESGCSVYGQDFSERMIELAAGKMPGAHLYRGDFSRGLAEPLLRQSYDFIVATYSLHHLKDAQKVSLLKTLTERLNGDGMILIGDIAFETRAEMERCRREVGDEWDDEEIYFVVDELREAFPRLSFERVSYCAGILSLPGKPGREQVLMARLI